METAFILNDISVTNITLSVSHDFKHISIWMFETLERNKNYTIDVGYQANSKHQHYLLNLSSQCFSNTLRQSKNKKGLIGFMILRFKSILPFGGRPLKKNFVENTEFWAFP